MRRFATLLVFACALLLLAAPARPAVQQERRVALVIGNGAYPTAPLKNPVNDARDMAATLKSLGFEVIERENASLRQMEDALDQFWSSLKKGGTGLFFFAGHGMQVRGVNYLVPVDARISVEQDVKSLCLDANRVLGRMENAGNGLNLVILDACRNNPFARSWRSADAGLAKMDAPTGTLIAYATAPDSVAADGAGKNGVYTSHLLRFMRAPGLKVEDVLKQVRIAVLNETGRKQTPWESSSLVGDFYFAGSGPQTASLAPVPHAPLQQSLAKPVPPAPQQQAMAPAPQQAPSASGEPRAGEIWTDPVTGMEFVWVPGGGFEMGCGPWAGQCAEDEKPLHAAKVGGFWIGKYEVTRGQWWKVMGSNPSDLPGGFNSPAEGVPWVKAKEFATKLSGMGTDRFRLPTEAEWEYAARSGGRPEMYSGSDDVARVAWYCVKGDCSASHPVGGKQPNGLGIYDMSGNVAEWCEDVYGKNAYASHQAENPTYLGDGADRVLRGGSWISETTDVRTGSRYKVAANRRPGGYGLGLRLVRDVPDAAQAYSMPQPAAPDALASRFAGRYAVASGPDKKPGSLILEFGVRDGQLVGTPSGGASSAQPVSITDIVLQGKALRFRYNYKLVVFGIASDRHTDFSGELGGDMAAIPFTFDTRDGNVRQGWLLRLPN